MLYWRTIKISTSAGDHQYYFSVRNTGAQTMDVAIDDLVITPNRCTMKGIKLSPHISYLYYPDFLLNRTDYTLP